MIRHDARPIGAARVAEILGITPGYLRTSGRTLAPGFPKQLNGDGRFGIWDEREIIAYRDRRVDDVNTAEQEVAEEAEEHPDDLLTDVEAAAAAGVAEATWRRKATTGRTGAEEVLVAGQRHWRRGSIVRRHAAPPKRGGRAPGDVDLAARSRHRNPAT